MTQPKLIPYKVEHRVVFTVTVNSPDVEQATAFALTQLRIGIKDAFVHFGIQFTGSVCEEIKEPKKGGGR